MTKVRFQNNWHVPGFPRSRFVKGVCEVPESMIDKLPRTAKILGDDYVEPETAAKVVDERRALDFGRAGLESTSPEALANAGMSGFKDVSEVVQKAEDAIGAAEAETASEKERADAAEDKLKELLKKIADSEDNEPADATAWVFDGQEYATEAAMKAARTRKEKKDA